jgi:tetratricopeptide (TPR) repeat protein
MAVQGRIQSLKRLPAQANAFALAALIALGLSLAAALVALFSNDTTSSTTSAVDEAAMRSQRVAFYEARAAVDPIDYVSLNRLAFEYLQRARETGDLDDYRRADYAATTSLSILSHDNYTGLVALGAVRLAQHDFAAALDLGERAVALKPGEAAGYGVRGDAAMALGRYDEAERDFQRMVTIEPGLAAVSRLAGLAFVRGDLLNAEDFWKQATRGDGSPMENVAWAEVQLGGLYFGHGNLEVAEKAYQRALKRYPDYVHALAGLASVRAAKGRLEEAAALFERAQTRQPLPQYVIALGETYEAMGRHEDAAARYALVDAIDALYRAGGVSTDISIALYYADHDRRLEEALALARGAYASAPGVYAADALAWALLKNGQPHEAKAKIDEALRLSTPEAMFHYHAGVIALALGDTTSARAELAKALDMNPHFSLLQAAKARQLLASLEGKR